MAENQAFGGNTLESKCYFKENNFYVLGDIDEEAEKEFFKFIEEQVEPELKKLDIERKNIKIHISSRGGYVSEASAIVGIIEYYKEKGIIFETYTRSMSASAATLITIAGTKGHRYINRYGDIMIHQLSCSAFGSLKYATDHITQAAVQWGTMKKIYLKHTALSEKKLDEIYESNKDWFITPSQAKEYSIVDHII